MNTPKCTIKCAVSLVIVTPVINANVIIATDLFGSFRSEDVGILLLFPGVCLKNASGNWCLPKTTIWFPLAFSLCLRPACHLLAYPIVLRLQLRALGFWDVTVKSAAAVRCTVKRWMPGHCYSSSYKEIKKEGGNSIGSVLGFIGIRCLSSPCHWFDSKVKFVRRSAVLPLHLDSITHILQTCGKRVNSVSRAGWIYISIQIWRRTNATL